MQTANEVFAETDLMNEALVEKRHHKHHHKKNKKHENVDEVNPADIVNRAAGKRVPSDEPEVSEEEAKANIK